MKLTDIVKLIESTAPPELQEEWDNSGIQIDCGNDISLVVTALDATDEVVDEAVCMGADLIITHHPLIFDPLKKLSVGEPVASRIISLVRAGISVYSSHTCFDRAPNGLNRLFGTMIGALNIQNVNDYCRKGILPQPMSLMKLAEHVAESIGAEADIIRTVGSPESVFSEVYWCTGAGADFIDDVAEDAGLCYITGDVKYHDARRAQELGIALIDAGHFATEHIFSEAVCVFLRESLSELKVVCAAEKPPFNIRFNKERR